MAIFDVVLFFIWSCISKASLSPAGFEPSAVKEALKISIAAKTD